MKSPSPPAISSSCFHEETINDLHILGFTEFLYGQIFG